MLQKYVGICAGMVAHFSVTVRFWETTAPITDGCTPSKSLHPLKQRQIINLRQKYLTIFNDILNLLHLWVKSTELGFCIIKHWRVAKPFYDFCWIVEWAQNTIRKLTYRKDDRVMRPMYGCAENFPQSLSTPTWSDRSCECAYKIWSS